MKILLVEDEKDVGTFIQKGLKERGHTVDLTHDGKDGLFLAVSEAYDIIILDRMLPNVDGLTLLNTLRASKNETPVLILSALDAVDERVKGLRAGADDYLVKPFAFEELIARIEVMASRRGVTADQTNLTCHDLEMNLLTRQVTRGGHPIDLQAREFKLLEFLMQHQGQVVTRTMLLENVWEYSFDPQTNVIDVHISRLRQKLSNGSAVSLIETVRGAGYRMQAPA